MMNVKPTKYATNKNEAKTGIPVSSFRKEQTSRIDCTICFRCVSRLYYYIIFHSRMNIMFVPLHNMFHDMFVNQSRLRRITGTKHDMFHDMPVYYSDMFVCSLVRYVSRYVCSLVRT
jgi:hypothetical protein